MDFIDLETFLAVADTLNLTKAAENLFVSQSTVTHRLKKLENELQYKLFIREQGKRVIELTIRGEEFLFIAQRWLTLQREMEALKHSYNKALSIASIDSVISMILPDILREISKKEYGINVTIQTEHTPAIYELVKKREVDIGFASNDANIPEVVTEPVFRQRFVLIKPCKSPVGMKQIHPSMLDPSYEIFQPWGYDYMKWHNYWWPGSVTPHIKFDSLTSLTNFLDDERYWSIVQQSSLKTVLKGHAVQVYEIIEPPPDWVCYKVKHKYPSRQSMGGIRTFDQIFDEFLKVTDLFE